MKRSDISIPPSLMLLIATIRKLTTLPTDETETYNQDILSYEDVFYASSCATIFLRLVCPAILSPLEWGALRRLPQQQSSSSSTSSSTSTASISSQTSQSSIGQLQHQQSVPHLQTEVQPKQRSSFFSLNSRTPSISTFSSSNNHRETESSLKTSSSGYREHARTSMRLPSFSRSSTHFKSNNGNNNKQDLHSQQDEELTEEKLNLINQMDSNPAVAVLILISYLLNNSHINLLNYISNDNLVNKLKDLIGDIIRFIPLHKLESYIEKYESKRNKTTFIDNSTKTVFESNIMKKILLEFAKNIQRIANLSIMRLPIIEVSIYFII